MRSRIPKTVKLFSKDWSIEFRKLHKKFGKCDHSNLRVSVNKRKPEKHDFDTVMHELVHAIDYEMKIGLTEKQVTRLGTGLAHLLKENPKLRNMFNG